MERGFRLDEDLAGARTKTMKDLEYGKGEGKTPAERDRVPLEPKDQLGPTR